MLTLTRNPGQWLVLGLGSEIAGIQMGRCNHARRVTVHAPESVWIERGEVFCRKLETRREAGEAVMARWLGMADAIDRSGGVEPGAPPDPLAAAIDALRFYADASSWTGRESAAHEDVGRRAEAALRELGVLR